MPFVLPPLGTPLPFDALIDVRSPAEFAEDHLPGAINLPALSDAERAHVGTIYVRQSRFAARRIGAAMVARNVAGHLDGPLAEKPKTWAPLVYCWRGGQRSGAVATILRQIGWRVETLDGGYRSYRRAVQGYLYDTALPHRLVVLDGLTGTAKTEILGLLAAGGAQVLDLEGLANHRGSLFGAASGGQPTQKTFESALAAGLAPLDPARPVVVEGESSKIGDRNLPPALWTAMCAAPRVLIDAPLAERARYCAGAYGDISGDGARLGAILDALRPYHSAERVKAWQRLAADGAFEALAAALMAEHYDPRYRRSSEARRGGTNVLGRVEMAAMDPAGREEAANAVVAMLAEV